MKKQTQNQKDQFNKGIIIGAFAVVFIFMFSILAYNSSFKTKTMQANKPSTSNVQEFANIDSKIKTAAQANPQTELLTKNDSNEIGNVKDNPIVKQNKKFINQLNLSVKTAGNDHQAYLLKNKTNNIDMSDISNRDGLKLEINKENPNEIDATLGSNILFSFSIDKITALRRGQSIETKLLKTYDATLKLTPLYIPANPEDIMKENIPSMNMSLYTYWNPKFMEKHKDKSSIISDDEWGYYETEDAIRELYHDDMRRSSYYIPSDLYLSLETELEDGNKYELTFFNLFNTERWVDYYGICVNDINKKTNIIEDRCNVFQNFVIDNDLDEITNVTNEPTLTKIEIGKCVLFDELYEQEIKELSENVLIENISDNEIAVTGAVTANCIYQDTINNGLTMRNGKSLINGYIRDIGSSIEVNYIAPDSSIGAACQCHSKTKFYISNYNGKQIYFEDYVSMGGDIPQNTKSVEAEYSDNLVFGKKDNSSNTSLDSPKLTKIEVGECINNATDSQEAQIKKLSNSPIIENISENEVIVTSVMNSNGTYKEAINDGKIDDLITGFIENHGDSLKVNYIGPSTRWLTGSNCNSKTRFYISNYHGQEIEFPGYLNLDLAVPSGTYSIKAQFLRDLKFDTSTSNVPKITKIEVGKCINNATDSQEAQIKKLSNSPIIENISENEVIVTSVMNSNGTYKEAINDGKIDDLITGFIENHGDSLKVNYIGPSTRWLTGSNCNSKTRFYISNYHGQEIEFPGYLNLDLTVPIGIYSINANFSDNLIFGKN